VRSRGVLYAQVAPTGGFVSGSSSVVKLDAWNWEDATIHTDEGMHVNWPRRRSYSWRAGGWSTNKNFTEQVQQIKDYFTEAKAYCSGDHEEKNLRLAAACGLFTGEQRLYLHVDQAADIEQAVMLGKSLAVAVVIVGGAESYLLTDLLKEAKVSVILGPTHALPNTADSDVNQMFKTPAMLHEAGVQFCLSNEGYWQQRNLPYQAGSAVAYGLPYEQAIQAITLDAARILGVDDQIGSLEVGKSASLILTEGDVLDMRSSQVVKAFIDGRDIDLDNKQEVLYRKFKTKYDRQ
jgi:imidazolonepropionase-like amidohydrolase